MTTCHLCGGERTNPHLSLEAAQAAAQADHDAYIRSALSGAAPQAGEDVPATQENDVFRSELLDAIQGLPPDERDAVILVHVVGYKEESDDPDESTAATRCNCTGRTICNRLTRAAAKLVRFKEAL